MNIGKFYFIKDSYFLDFPDDKLEKNKDMIDGVLHSRPCFCGLLDKGTGLFWMIPISSKVEKYKKIYFKAINKRGFCDTLAFGDFIDSERVFLIQNMFPVTYSYIANEYIDYKTNKPFTISKNTEIEIDKKARTVLSQTRKGRNLIFPNVLEIERILLSR